MVLMITVSGVKGRLVNIKELIGQTGMYDVKFEVYDELNSKSVYQITNVSGDDIIVETAPDEGNSDIEPV